MKNIYVFLIILFIFISCSNVCASNFQSDIEMTNPVEDLEIGQQWLKDNTSTEICATAIRDYNFCLNRYNKYNLGYDCYKEKMALKSCWDKHWARVEQNCQMSENSYYQALDSRDFHLANIILEGANGCDWQKEEKRKIRDFICNNNGRKFGRSLSDSNYDQCKRILRDSRDCDWYEKGKNDLYSNMRGSDFPSVANPRPTYPAGVLLDKRLCGNFALKEGSFVAQCASSGGNEWKCKYTSGTVSRLFNINISGTKITMERKDIKGYYNAKANYWGVINGNTASGRRSWHPAKGSGNETSWSANLLCQ